MRSSGTVQSAVALQPGDHLCWPYADRHEVLLGAVEYAAEGIARNERVVYVCPSGVDPRVDLAALSAVDDLVAHGALVLQSIDAEAARGRSVDVAAMDSHWSDAAQHALDAGFRGVRVFVDSTAFVRTADQLDAFVRWEQHFDRRLADHLPFTGVCAFDVTELGEGAAAELACVHPLVRGEAAPFRLFAREHGELALAGDLDGCSAPLLERTLRRLDTSPCAEITIDASTLHFMAHRALLAFEDHATAIDGTVVLREAPRTTVRLATLLRLERVHLESPG